MGSVKGKEFVMSLCLFHIVRTLFTIKTRLGLGSAKSMSKLLKMYHMDPAISGICWISIVQKWKANCHAA